MIIETKELAAALRSGQYTQTFGQLWNGLGKNCFCVIGVALELARKKEGKGLWVDGGFLWPGDSDYVISGSLCTGWVPSELEFELPTYIYLPVFTDRITLSSLNDNGVLEAIRWIDPNHYEKIHTYPDIYEDRNNGLTFDQLADVLDYVARRDNVPAD